MVQRINGGVFNNQIITGSLRHFVLEGADFSGAVDMFGRPVPNSAAEIIFTNISEDGYINIMNPNQYNISFALEINRSHWTGHEMTAMVQSLGNNVGADHIDCSVCTVTEVPYIWNLGASLSNFLNLSDTPHTYAGAAGFAVIVNSTQTGLTFAPITQNSFSHVAVDTQPTLNALINSTLTFRAGNNILLTTDVPTNTVTIASTSSASSDYIPIPPGTVLTMSNRYYVTSAGTVILPASPGAGFVAGQSIIISKPVFTVVFVDIGSPTDVIATDLGVTDSVEFDATQEIILIFDGDHTWNLQIGSTTY